MNLFYTLYEKNNSCVLKLHISFVSLQYDFKSVANE